MSKKDNNTNNSSTGSINYNKDNINNNIYKETKIYEDLGVSHSKEEVHKAIKNVDKGIYPSAFCKILPDISGDPSFCSVFHSDSAGTKTILAYMMYKETQNLDFFRGVVQDAIVMNVDDALCVGVDGNSLISDTVGRNKKLISGEILNVIIDEFVNFTKKLSDWGFGITLAGGETEDIGDLIRTLEIGVSLFSRLPRSKIIKGNNISPGDIIIGLSCFGKTKYDPIYNSGIGSNGITLARHGTLCHDYYKKYPECRDPLLKESMAFFGKYKLEDPLPNTPLRIGEALLSPTRTYVPVLLEIFRQYRHEIHAIFHCTGGGQTKCLHFGKSIVYIKDNLFPIPPIFKLIQQSSGASWKEMYQVFNMGHRMEIIIPDKYTEDIINISKTFGVEAKAIGYIEKNQNKSENKAIIKSPYGDFSYSLSI
ncbi:MAG: AIR synthase-related protein [Promethearchaeota archaeon]